MFMYWHIDLYTDIKYSIEVLYWSIPYIGILKPNSSSYEYKITKL